MAAIANWRQSLRGRGRAASIVAAQVLAFGGAEALAQQPVQGQTDPSPQVIRSPENSIRRNFELLSEDEIKEFYIRCSSVALSRPLDGSEAVACSVGYDVLLQRHFDGDFHALLDWSRQHREVGGPLGVNL